MSRTTKLLGLYQQHRGGISRVFDWLMLSRPDMDSHRFGDMFEAAIAAGGWCRRQESPTGSRANHPWALEPECKAVKLSQRVPHAALA
jgi:hypothetical protein